MEEKKKPNPAEETTPVDDNKNLDPLDDDFADTKAVEEAKRREEQKKAEEAAAKAE